MLGFAHYEFKWLQWHLLLKLENHHHCHIADVVQNVVIMAHPTDYTSCQSFCHMYSQLDNKTGLFLQ